MKNEKTGFWIYFSVALLGVTVAPAMSFSTPMFKAPAIEVRQFGMEQDVIEAMAKPPPRREETISSAPGKPVATGRYIVTHTCPNRSPEQITAPMGGVGYQIESTMQFTPQFVISASDEAITRLRNLPCVSQIQRDGLSAPAQ